MNPWIGADVKGPTDATSGRTLAKTTGSALLTLVTETLPVMRACQSVINEEVPALAGRSGQPLAFWSRATARRHGNTFLEPPG